jgi:cytoskeletal protein RodZ
VTVGETLTEARYQAGLSVDELSERTRIREKVIRSIEQDDYEACGGDLYVRGYVRAIAGAVGIDAQPLIREYDLGRATGTNERANGSTGRHAKGFPTAGIPAVPEADIAPIAFDLPPVTAGPTDADTTRLELPAVSEDPAPTAFDLPPVTEDLMDAGYDLDAEPAPAPVEQDAAGPATAIIPALVPVADEPQGVAGQAAAGQPGGNRPRGWWYTRRGFVAVAGIAAVVVAGALAITMSTGGGTRTRATAAPRPSANAAARASAAAKARAEAEASASASASAAKAAAAQASAKAQASKAAAARAAAQRVVTLPVASAQAFGPNGFADGDNPGSAGNAIAGAHPAPWSTQWYTTADFGMLKHGTGLLLDLGHPVTITSLRVGLSQYPGADVQIRVGNGTAQQELKTVATAQGAGGVVRLAMNKPVAARYLLIWFTQLAPDGSGHYQESVSNAVVSGHR